MRNINFSDGYETASAPTAGAAALSKLLEYADDAAFVSAKGSAASEGDIYKKAGSPDYVRIYMDAAWTSFLTSAVVTLTEAGYLSGVTSAIQTQIDQKQFLSIAPSIQKFTSGSGTYAKNYAFKISSGSATVGATYTNNGITYTVWATVSSATLVYMYGSGAPTASGTLTKASGTGDSTLTFSRVAAPLYLRVRLVGGGAGGGCSGSAGGGSPTAGGNTTFGSTLVVGNGGGAGGTAGSNSGSGGTASLGTGVVGTAMKGASGGVVCYSVAGYESGSMGAGTPLGGGGYGGFNSAGEAPSANTGAGGGGGGTGNNANMYGGHGGASGGYCDAIIASPADTYAYAVGAAGTGGTLGTNGTAGGNGAAGYLEVTEFYQ